MPDRSGAVNNFVEIDDQEDGFDFEDFVSAPMASSPPGSYEQTIPKLDNTTKPPPTLPPHLMQGMYVCMYLCMYVCKYVCMYVFVYMYLYVCMYVCMYVCIACMYVCVCSCEYILFIYTYVYQ